MPTYLTICLCGNIMARVTVVVMPIKKRKQMHRKAWWRVTRHQDIALLMVIILSTNSWFIELDC